MASSWFNVLPFEILEHLALHIWWIDCACWTTSNEDTILQTCFAFAESHLNARAAMVGLLRSPKARLFMSSTKRCVEIEEEEEGLDSKTLALFGIQRVPNPDSLKDIFLERAFENTFKHQDGEFMGLLVAGANPVGRYYVSGRIDLLNFLLLSDPHQRGLYALAQTHANRCIMTASHARDMKLLEELLINLNFSNYATSGLGLLQAIRCSNVELLRRLLAHNEVDPNDGPYTLLLEAVRQPQPIAYQLVSVLLEHGVDVNFDNDRALCDVIDGPPNLEMVELLLQYGADPTARDCEPLLTACKLNLINTVDVLIAYGAKHDKALVFAVQNNSVRMVQMLLQAGCDPSANQAEAVTLALKNQSSDEIITMLVEAGSKINSEL